MKTAAITGITGFVGGNLSSYLEADTKVIGLSRRSSEEKNLRSYEDIKVDDLNECEAFIHLAGKAHDMKNVSNEHDYFEANTELTKQLFDLFLQSQCKVFIYMSSVKAAADKVELILHEEDNPNPKTAYGKSKLAAEEYIQSQTVRDNQRVYILRPCMIHGPGNKGNLNLLYAIINKRVPYPLAAYQNRRSFLSVENLCFVIRELIQSNVKSGVYNVADDEAISTNELIKIIGQAIHKKARLVPVPKFVIAMLAKLGDLMNLPLTTERLHKLTENYVVSNKKIKAALQKDFPLGSRDGLKQTIQSFNNE